MRTIKLKNGNPLAYRDQGDGPVMVLVHGWGVSGALFENQLQALSGRFRMVVPDLPGHGSSGEFVESDKFSSLADAVAELIQTLELDHICLLGWSLGAMVSWDLLKRYPQLGIDRLVIVDMVPNLLNDGSWRHGLRETDDPGALERNTEFMLNDWTAYTNVVVPRWLSPADQTSPELVDLVRQVMLKNDPKSLARIWALLEKQDLRETLKTVHVPALVIAGGKSTLFSTEASEWVTQHMSNARLEVLQESGHAPHLDQAADFNNLLLNFITNPVIAKAGQNGAHKS